MDLAATLKTAGSDEASVEAKLLKSSHDGREKRRVEFRELLDRLVALLSQAGIEVVAYDDARLPLFMTLEDEVQETVCNGLREYIVVNEQMVKKGEDLRYSHRPAWAMLSRLGWRHLSDLFGQLSTRDIVEIYSVGGIQLFRSLRFFELVSYTLEQIFTTPWFRLFWRSPEINEVHLEMHQGFADGRWRVTQYRDIPAYQIREQFGPKNYVCNAQFRLTSPLFSSDNEIVGYVHVFNAQLETSQNL